MTWEDLFWLEVLRRNAERFGQERFKMEVAAFAREKWEEFQKVGRKDK
ncbi:hypothetical protein [Desulfofundulus thermosubterraneus]|nr:hypothetical protein [Desulfofundulus thermosubterraneus]